jgi:hypothetical protein
VTCEEALQAIADGRLPCRTCREVHPWQPFDPEHPHKGGTYKHPVDRHSYNRMSAKKFARQVLDGRR